MVHYLNFLCLSCFEECITRIHLRLFWWNVGLATFLIIFTKYSHKPKTTIHININMTMKMKMKMNARMAALVLLLFAMSSYSAFASQISERRRLRRRTQRHEATRVYGIDSTTKKNDLGISVNDSGATLLETQVGWEVERLLNVADTSLSMSMPSPTTAPPTPDQSASTQPPTKEFDFNECESYSNDWLFELASNCDSPTSLDNCVCPTAKALLNNGTISCANESEFGAPSVGACPEGCTVCQFCMVTSGCPDIYGVAGQQLPFTRKLDLPTPK